MRLLVTGATGFLGRRIVARVAAAGHEVVATGRNVERGRALASVGVEFREAELSQRGDVVGLCESIDVVVHSAALSSPWGPYADFHRANVRSTELLLEEARRTDVQRFVHVSTPGLHARPRHQYAIREDAPLPRRPANHYIATKRIAEDRVKASGLPYIILRPRGLFGPEDTSVIPRLVRALETGRLPLIGDGDNLADLTYVDNAADAVNHAIAAHKNTCGTYHITNGEPVRLWDTIFLLADELGLPRPSRRVSFPTAYFAAAALELRARLTPGRPEPFLTRYTVSLLACSTTLDISAAVRELGYRPRVSMDEGIEHFLRWWRTK